MKSLEDKAKEIVDKIADEDAYGYVWRSDMGKCPHCDHNPVYVAKVAIKQALKDMMERVGGVTCYAACCECYMTDDFFTLESLKKIAEDLGK